MRGIGMSGPLSEGSLRRGLDGRSRHGHGRRGLRRATLVAHGHGAQMALMAAATHPERICSLVLVNGYAKSPAPTTIPPGCRSTCTGPISTARAAVGHRRAMARSARPSYDGPASWSGGRAWSATARCRVSRGPARDDSRPRRPQRSPARRGPTLVVHAATTCSSASGTAATWPSTSRARALERDSADHWPRAGPGLIGAIEEFVTGSRAGAGDADRVLATVLFVDVVGSTAVRGGARRSQRGATRSSRFEQVGRARSCSTRGSSRTPPATVFRHVRRPGSGDSLREAHPRRGCACSGLEVRSGLHAGEVTRRREGVAGSPSTSARVSPRWPSRARCS